MNIIETVIELTKVAIEHDPNFSVGTPYAEKLVKFMQTLKSGLEEMEKTKERP